MPQRIMIDMIHLTLYVSDDLAKSAQAKVRRCLKGRSFQRQLREQIRTLLQHYPSLRSVHFALTD